MAFGGGGDLIDHVTFVGEVARRNYSCIWVVIDDTLVVTGINGIEVTI